jgi:uncharacterized protein (DUF608 family)
MMRSACGSLYIVVTAQVIADVEEYVTTIDSGSFTTVEMFPAMSIQIPSELTRALTNQSTTLRAVSYAYHNVESLFPQGLTGVNRYNCDNTVVVM